MEDTQKFTVKQGIRNVLLIGLVSMFIDLSTEMVYPLVTIYLSTFTTVAIVGVIEGIAEATASLLKVYSGFIGDKYQNKKRLAFLGYGSALAYKVLLFFSFNWVGILVARLVDRVGKGIRTAPRDALVAASGGKELGRAFGLHKTFDMFGAGTGVLVSILLYNLLVSENGAIVDVQAFKSIFLISIIPTVLGLVALSFVVEKKDFTLPKEKFTLRGLKLDRRVVGYLGIVFAFAVGYPSDAFLILRAGDAGFGTASMLLLYFIYYVSGSLLSYPLGKLSDKFGRRKLVVPAYLLFGLVYLGFAFAGEKWMFYPLFVAYGLFTAMVNGAEKAFLSEYAPKHVRGTVLGLYGTAQGIGYLFASIIAGLLWDGLGSYAPFLLGALLGVVSASASLFVMALKPHPVPQS